MQHVYQSMAPNCTTLLRALLRRQSSNSTIKPQGAADAMDTG
jgi:hypothetical protein